MRPSTQLRRACPRVQTMLRSPAFAVVAALVWLLGVELGPGLHMARHGELGHHHHGVGEALSCSSHEGEGHEHHASAEHHEHHGTAGHHGEAQHDDHLVAVEHHEHRAAGHHHGHAEPHGHHAEPHGHHAKPHEHAGPAAHHTASEPAPVVVQRLPHDVPAAAPATDPATLAHAHGSVPHGAGSLAHRDLVPLTPPLALPPILSAPWRPLEVTAVVHVDPRERAPETLRARGPPRGGPVPEPPVFA